MKTIIEMAREADIDWHRHWNDDGSNHLEAFAKLVREDEREACAKVCDELRGINWGPEQCATAIRARSNT